MKLCCLKCRENTENINPRVSKTSVLEQWYYQNLQYVIVKNEDLLKTKKQIGYYAMYVLEHH